MSYEVTVGSNSFNYTSNVRKFFQDHIQADDGDEVVTGIQAINGKTGRQAVVIIGEAFDRMNTTRHKMYVNNVAGEPKMSQKYDNEQGWGSMVGAMIFVGQIMAACAANPRSIVQVYA